MLRYLTLVVLVAVAPSPQACAQSVSFVKIVDDTIVPQGTLSAITWGGNSSIFDLNNNGRVVFASYGGQITPTIYTGNGGPLTVVAASGPAGGVDSVSPAAIAINDADQVAWMRTNFLTHYVYRGGVPIFQVTIPTGGPIPELPYPTEGIAINNSGALAFETIQGGNRLLRGNGGPLTEIIPNWGSGGFFSMNDAGTVAMMNLPSPSPGPGIFTGNGGPLALIQGSYSLATNQFFSPSLTMRPSINNAGDVAFITQGGVVRIGNATSFSDYTSFGEISAAYPSLNNLGQVAYYGNGGSHGLPTSIFVGPDVLTDKLISVGDALDGSTVSLLSIPDLNDHGEVAFMARLANGRTGIYVATTRGSSQNDPILPDTIGPPLPTPPPTSFPLPPGSSSGGPFGWTNRPVGGGAGPGGGNWFDPPSASGFLYQTTDDSLFTEVGLPVGVEPGGDGLFTISGNFGIGGIFDSTTLPEGSFFTFPTPVDQFMITGINPQVDESDPLAFPTYLEFDQATVSFEMIPLLQAETVPEPSSFVLGLLGLVGMGLFVRHRWRV